MSSYRSRCFNPENFSNVLKADSPSRLSLDSPFWSSKNLTWLPEIMLSLWHQRTIGNAGGRHGNFVRRPTLLQGCLGTLHKCVSSVYANLHGPHITEAHISSSSPCKLPFENSRRTVSDDKKSCFLSAKLLYACEMDQIILMVEFSSLGSQLLESHGEM